MATIPPRATRLYCGEAHRQLRAFRRHCPRTVSGAIRNAVACGDGGRRNPRLVRPSIRGCSAAPLRLEIQATRFQAKPITEIESMREARYETPEHRGRNFQRDGRLPRAGQSRDAPIQAHEGLDSGKQPPRGGCLPRPNPSWRKCLPSLTCHVPREGDAVRLAVRSRSGYPTEATGSACPHSPAPSTHPAARSL